MANQKVYSITINGLTESISAVDALNKQLDQLDKRISALQGKAVNIGAKSSGGGSKSSSTSLLSEEEALQKEINNLKNEGTKLDAKIIAAQEEIYKKVQATKDIYKETVEEQKALSAAERLQANTYSNTMAGMKQHLADLKAVINTTDLGDGDQIKEMTDEANELTKKLKEMEEAYGQFGRNVGNYRSSLNGITVTIGETTREFKNSREALRALKQELDSLSVSEKGNTEYAKKLRAEYNKLKSAIDDSTKSSKFMDNALDSMQSFTALNQVTRGFTTFFGIDNTEIEKQIAKLVALQNALEGLEKLNKQIDSEEGIGKWLAAGSRGVDQFITRVTGAEKRMGIFVGSTRKATVAINAFSKALKGIGAIGIVGAITLITNYVGGLIDKFVQLTSSENKVGDASKYIESELTTMANTVNRLKNTDLDMWFKGLITDTAYLKNNLELLSRQLIEVLSDIEEISPIETSVLNIDTDKVEKLDKNAIKNFKKQYLEALKELEYIQTPGFSWDKFFGSEKSIKEKVANYADAILNDFLSKAKQVSVQARNEIIQTGKVSDTTTEKIKELVKEANEDFATNSVITNVEDFSSRGSYYAKQVDFVTESLKKLNEAANTETLSPEKMAQLRVDGMKSGAKKIKAQNELNRKKEIDDANGNLAAIDLINKKFDIQLQEQLKSVNQQYLAALNDLKRLQIENMKDGLAKQLAQLEQEKKEKIQAIVADGNLVKQRSEEVEKKFIEDDIKLRKDWAKRVKQIYETLNGEIEALRAETFDIEASNAEININTKLSDQKFSAWENIGGGYDDTADISKRIEYYDKILSIETNANEKLVEIREHSLSEQFEVNKKEEELRHSNVADAKAVAMVMAEVAKYESENGGAALTSGVTNYDWSGAEKKLKEELKTLNGTLLDAYNNGEIDFKTFVTLIQNEQEAHNAKMNALQKQFNAQSKQNTDNGINEQEEAYSRYYQNILSSFRQTMDDISRGYKDTPIINNDWGVVNISQTKRAYEEALRSYSEMNGKLIAKRNQLIADFKSKKIKPEDYFLRLSEFNALIAAVIEASKKLKENQKNLVSDFMQSISQYINAGFDALNTIMSAVFDAQNNAFDKEQEQLDKELEMIQEKLSEYEQIAEEHKNNIDSIEDELATSRGDRRQYLIDQLNNEVEAQRRAEAEKQRLQKEEEKNKAKQEKLELKRKKAQYKQQMLQAIVNGAMAVTFAAMNTWPIPAIPLMATAAATTAAQLAIMAANKPYRVGGQLEGGLVKGKRHTQGGVPVGNTGIEVEGDEMIIRRESTLPNIDLLNFINKSQKRVDLDDMIEFYSSGKVKKTIKNMSPKTKYADGGTLPSLSYSYDINDRLISAFEQYASTPQVVQVVDIIDRTEAVKQVQVLAGLSD